ncbi:chloramphenicol acetyltransferase [Hymenobacter cellulosilyticus]|uniref:Chloramphenicol acetyltransferase n=1 Tax=Hymenobacter cellulosilyticus TaxID=2932248 RepID=A0A8T9Q6N1_9BACT|nr:chloramphenicol acetyltransferase [Hymenobacter cellulosilyticus]UOQ71129.1 chloramphenicol acetyltransferase [Hymenobacter cellulosilyticus]
MKQLIDLATWNRREHFAFFSAFEEPFFGLVAPVECTGAQAEAKRRGVSFFLYYLYHAVQAANEVPELRTRIEDGQVYQYERVHASATLGRADRTFAFSFIEQHDELSGFVAAATAEMEAVQNSFGLRLSNTTARVDVLHCSAIPWVRFTGLTHARSFSHPDSCPKISFSQLYEENGRTYMNVAVNVHHALADGYHVGQFLQAFERRLTGEMVKS